MITNTILTIVIFWTFFWSWINFARLIAKNKIPTFNSLYMAIGWTAIITHIIGIW